MSVIIPYGVSFSHMSGNILSTGKSQIVAPLLVLAVQRYPSDPYFYADVIINDAIIGSRYWMVKNADHSEILATGLITSSPQVVLDVPSYGSSMIILLRLRNASDTSKYKTYEALTPHTQNGTSFYCSQQRDD